jgi:hypothetical protein
VCIELDDVYRGVGAQTEPVPCGYERGRVDAIECLPQ